MRFAVGHAIIITMKHIYMRGQVAGGQWPVESGGAVPALNHNRNHNRRLRIPSFCQKHGVKKIRPNFPSDISDSIFLTESLVICPVFLSADGQRSKKGFLTKRTHFYE